MKPTFKKATRKQAKLKIGITGPSGSGKTYSALKLANGFLDGKGKIAVIDTENGSASLYSDLCEYDVLELKPPFTSEKYAEYINAAVEANYDFLIIDSISHAWAGEGGILDQKSKLDMKGGNSFTNWAKFTPVQERFLASILHSDINIICTMRSKQDYVMSQNSKGKQAPQKVGLAPVQREGFEYELTLVIDMDMQHNAQSSKDRTGLFNDQIFTPSEDTGKKLREWVNGGIEDNSFSLKEFKGCLSIYCQKSERKPLDVIKEEFGLSGDEINNSSSSNLEDMTNRLMELK